MNRVRSVLLLSMGLALVALTGLCGAQAAVPADPAAATVTAAGQPSGCTCEDELTCSCGCSPLAGAWIASLFPKEEDAVAVTGGKDATDGKEADGIVKKIRPFLKTFKFAPVNTRCDKFVLNAQTITRPDRVIRAFAEVTAVTEFVGIACKAESKEFKFTALSFGVERTLEIDRLIFIAVLSGTVKLPEESKKDAEHAYKCKCCEEECKESKCTCKNGTYDDEDHPSKCACCKNGCKYSDCECESGKYGKNYGKDEDKDEEKSKCKEPEKLYGELTIAYFDAEQDEDGDGFPDAKEPIACLAYRAEFKRVVLLPQCEPAKTDNNTVAPVVAP